MCFSRDPNAGLKIIENAVEDGLLPTETLLVYKKYALENVRVEEIAKSYGGIDKVMEHLEEAFLLIHKSFYVEDGERDPESEEDDN